MQPTFMDHYYLNFWLWACLHDAETYLEVSRQFSSIMRDTKDWAASHNERLSAKRHLDLEQYHFVVTMGSMVKHITRLAPLFPSIQIAFDAAQHLREEGLYLRNMVEHTDRNLEAVRKGTPCGGFVRRSNLLPNLPGDSRGSSDATSTIIDQDGHWLGGRLNVERVIAEVRLIYEAAQAIPSPVSRMG